VKRYPNFHLMTDGKKLDGGSLKKGEYGIPYGSGVKTTTPDGASGERSIPYGSVATPQRRPAHNPQHPTSPDHKAVLESVRPDQVMAAGEASGGQMGSSEGDS